MKNSSFLAGFSLLELLIVITISLVILGGALASFLSFTDRREVVNAVGELKIYLESAQAKAKAGDLGGCDRLAGYQVQSYLNNNLTEVSLQAVCETGSADSAEVFKLPSGITVTPNLDVTYAVLNGGVNLSGASEDITVTGSNNSYVFTLYREGRVSEGDWQ